MKRLIILIAAVYIFSLVVIFKWSTTTNKELSNMVQVNDIVYTFRNSWPDVGVAIDKLKDYDIEYLIVGMRGEILAASSENLRSNYLADTIYQGMYTEIQINEKTVGKIIIIDDMEKNILEVKKESKNLLFIITTTFFLILCCIICYIDKKILEPIGEFKKFSKQVAIGNYNSSISRYNSKFFGLLSESFEVMREELLFQQKKGQQADKNRREVIATISHDIKNPVASIQSIAEFQLYIADKDELRREFKNIIEKTNQINCLVQNLHTSILDDLERLSVELQEEESSVFKKLFQQADYKKKMQNIQIIECLILLDQMRLQQVLDNIISNSYKYADTKIDVSSYCIDGYLCICINDDGVGVPKEEEIFLMQKYYRGKNAEKKDGSGIGLYVSEYLVKRMGGRLECGMAQNGGFEVKIFLKLV